MRAEASNLASEKFPIDFLTSFNNATTMNSKHSMSAIHDGQAI